MTVKEFYQEIGGNYEEILSRLMSEKLILKFVGKFLNDPSYEGLCQALEKEDYEEGFRQAHTLKGICLNLGFGNLARSSSELTEKLRHGETDGVTELLEKVKVDYKQVAELLKQNEWA